MTNAFIVKAGLTIVALATAVALSAQRDPAQRADDSLQAAVARQELRVEAARESLDAKPLIGESNLRPYDAKAAMAREESALRRLTSLQQASR